MKTLTTVFTATFEYLDKRIHERWSIGNLAHGFWRASDIPRLEPVDTLREYGFWQAHADLSGLCGIEGVAGQCSVALVGGHTRIGVFLPKRLLEGVSPQDASYAEAVSKAHDGQPTPIVRSVGGDTLFDHILADAPFSADWLLRCTQESEAENILHTHLAWRVIDLWESTMRVLLSRQSEASNYLITSTKPLPAIVTEAVAITLQDVYEIQSGQWITVAEMKNTLLSAPELETQLQNLLPEHEIHVQKETRT